MKKLCIFLLLLVIPIFAEDLGFVPVEPISRQGDLEIIELEPVPFLPSPDETLQYDNGTFNNGLGLQGSGTPTTDQTFGFATYFVLSQFGITQPRKVHYVMMNWNLYNTATNFRLYVWSNTPGSLQPISHGTHLYSNLATTLPPVQTWGSWDLSSDSVVLPDTFWIGLCYNELTTPASWYVSMNTGLADVHTYGNLSGTAGSWVAMGSYGYAYAYGVRVVVEEIAGAAVHDVGTTSIDMAATVPLNTTLAPVASVANFGDTLETFDVGCTIEPGSYTSTFNIVDLAPGETTQVEFPDSFTFVSGFYTMTVFTQLGTDIDLTNDTLSTTIEATGIAEGNNVLPREFRFETPTICNGQLNIELALPTATHVDLAIYDVSGQLCGKLASGIMNAGYHVLDNKLTLANGIYFLKLKAGTEINLNRKLLVVR